MRLVDADALLHELVTSSYPQDVDINHAYRIFQNELAAAPTVDAVEVVRCRECRWCNMGECEHKFGLLVSNDENYCSYGERSVDI